MKRNNGDGSVSFESSRNKYRAQFKDRDGKRIIKRFNTKNEAELFVENCKMQIALGRNIDTVDYTLGEWVDKFIIEYKAKKLRRKTLKTYCQIAKLLEPISKVHIRKLTVYNVEEFMKTVDKSSSTRRKVYLLLKSSMTKAKSLGILDYNVMENVEAPEQEKVEIEIYSDEELEKIRKFLIKDKYYNKYFPLYILAVQTGARLGELLGLKIPCVHNDYISIENNLQSDSHSSYDERPKTSSSYRKIPINPETFALLQSVISNRYKGYVFQTSNGTPLAPSNVHRTWVNILKGSEVERKHFHALRHTFASKLLAQGIPIANVSRVLGHSSVDITLRIYTHALKEYDSGIAKVTKSFFKKSS